ncbi:beta-N-acetylhexosaminidase [Streptomyces sp. RKND-216]|nr:beta-N-acetylhexosaminidase [Streptomyces sp. RKND-216]
MIPAPRVLEAVGGGPFTFTGTTAVEAGPGTAGAARLLRSALGAATGLPLPPRRSGDEGPYVALAVDDDGFAAGPGLEAYRLDVDAGGVRITGGGVVGVHHGVQTLRQLLPPAAYRRAPVRSGPWTVPPVHVEDAPRFRWRGHLLDVARHFQPKDDVLRCLDLLALHKLNVLHLHLTDDQGWRLQIRRHPRLTEVGAWRPRTRLGHRASPLWDERPHGGFYTHDDIREIVAYAAERHITVVPEIDVPGHSQAAVAAHPELGNADAVDTAALGVWTDWGVSPHVLAPTDRTLRFYEEVLEEVLELFPSPWIHVGGDEVPTGEWRASPAAQDRIRTEGLSGEPALHAWFVSHFARHLAARGRRAVGWDEILDAGAGRLPPDAVVSSWRGYAGGIAAAEAGHDVVMCPEQQVYLDHRQHPGEVEPVPLGYVRTLEDVYRFEPVPPRLAGTPAAARVLGAQANMWTEAAETRQRVDYQTHPRLAAFAEVVWSDLPPPAARLFDDFRDRLEGAHLARLDALGVDYRPPAGPRPWQRRPGVLGRPIEGPPPIV